MNGLQADALALARALRDGAPGCDLLVCPPATVLAAVAGALAGGPVLVGGQDCHVNAHGPHTGDVSAAMLWDAGARWIILGHSERRQDHHDIDAVVHAKVAAAQSAGLQTIVCVGETERQRFTGHAQAVVAEQLRGSLPSGYTGVIAYEPIWAIGTGRTPTPADVVEMHAAIRADLVAHHGSAGGTVRILYGGSVKPDNAAEFLALPEVGGALVGGASLVAADFLAIAAAAQGA
ncbi:MAG: triose-phosphate isomerase [Gemmatimonadaceae bacterium]|nr:triose-phosphate isomerase [Acetobacteraceae bacterium]